MRSFLLAISLMVGIALLSLFTVLPAQSVKTITLDNPDEALMLNEFGGLVLNANDTVKVEMVSPPDQREDIYKDVNIEAGDIIRMANGKKIKSVKTLKDIYEKTKPGDEIKLAIFRDKQVVMTKFIKGDFEAQSGNITMMTMTFDDNNAIIQALMGVGLILEEKDGKIEISGTVDNMTPKFESYKPQTGDIITGFQGKEIESTKALDEAYQSINPGDKVTLNLLHEGKKVETSFIKPDIPAMKTIMKKTE